VTIVPSTPQTIAVGQTLGVSAVIRDLDGRTIPGRTAVFTSSAPLVATVDSVGSVRTLSAGTTTITATAGGSTSTLTVTVTGTANPVATITVTPQTSTILVNNTIQLAATLRDALGLFLVDRTVLWESSNPGIAIVGQTTGTVRGQSVGTVTITATSEGRSASVTVNVQ